MAGDAEATLMQEVDAFGASIEKAMLANDFGAILALYAEGATSLEVPGMSAPIQDTGKYLTVYVRDDDGSLKIKAETWNTDTNPMATAGHEHAQGAH